PHRELTLGERRAERERDRDGAEQTVERRSIARRCEKPARLDRIECLGAVVVRVTRLPVWDKRERDASSLRDAGHVVVLVKRLREREAHALVVERRARDVEAQIGRTR